MAKSPTRKRAAPKAAPDPTPPPRIVSPVPDRVERLAFPVEYGGRTYDTITLRRPSSGVLGRWFEQYQDDAVTEMSSHLNVPIFVDEAGELVPDAVLGALDDDDRQTVFRDTDAFFPRRLSVALEALTLDSAPSDGAPAEPRSSA